MRPRLRPHAALALAALWLCATAPGAAAWTVELAPAAGPAGTEVALTTRGVPRGRAVTVRWRRTALARGRGDTVLRATIPARARRSASLVARAGRQRAVTTFAVLASPARTATTEVASSTGARVRMGVTATAVRLRGQGFRPRRRVLAAGRAVRADRRGAFRLTLDRPAGPTTLSVVSGRRRFRLTVPEAAVTPTSLTLPVRAAFYYPWFPESWRQRGFDPYTVWTPSRGRYDSGTREIIAAHVDDLRYAGLQAGIASWWGPGTRTDGRIPALLEAARPTPFRWGLYYEPEGNADPSPDEIRAHLEYIRDRYAGDPAYLRVAGRFVVFVWTKKNDAADMARRWKAGNTVGAYIVLKVFDGYAGLPPDQQPDGWHQYGPAEADAVIPGQAHSVSPGFWLKGEARPRLERDPARFRASVRRMAASGLPWQLVTTYNEWGEGTAVEPAQEWATPSGRGTYLEILHEELSG